MPEEKNDISVSGQGNHLDNIRQINGDYIEIHYNTMAKNEPESIITSRSAWKLNKNYLRRTNELETLKEMLCTDPDSIIQIRGIGGIGKTSFCCQLFWDYYDALSSGNSLNGILHLGWIPYNGDLKSSIHGLIKSETVSADDPDIYLQQAKRFFDHLGHSLLLFIDNVDGIIEKDIDFLRSCSCRVVLTARYEIEEFDGYLLPAFSPETCLALYQKFSNDIKEENKPIIKQILEIAGFHTQAICLLARTQRESGYTSQELLTELQKSGFSLKGITVSVESGRPEGSFEATFTEHMRKLFDIAKISDVKQLHVLRMFSMLAPNMPLSRRIANEWFDSYSLKKLIKSGWLNTDENGDVYIHSVIAATVQSKYPPDAKKATGLINNLIDTLKKSEGKGIVLQNRLLPHGISVVKALFGTEMSDFATLLDRIGVIAWETEDYDLALSYYYYALETKEKVYGSNHPELAITYNNIAIAYQSKSDYEKTLEYHEKARAIREKMLGMENSYTAWTYGNFGYAYLEMGIYDKALEFLEKARVIFEKVVGVEHSETARTYHNIGMVYKFIGDYEKAVEYHEKARIIREKVLDEDSPITAWTYGNLGSVYQDIGNFHKALEYYDKAQTIDEKVLGVWHSDTAVIYYDFGDLFREMGKLDDAMKYAERARLVFEQKLGMEHPLTAKAYNLLALIYLEQGDESTALQFAEFTKNIYTKKKISEHPFTAINFRTLAKIYLSLKDTEKALEYTEKASAIKKKLGETHSDTRGNN